MRHLVFFIVLMSQTVLGQIGTGQWRLHVTTRKAIDVTAVNNVVYSAYENGLLEYDPAYNEHSLWTDVNGLSDVNVTCLGSHGSSGSLYIGYNNGNIDRLTNNRVINIPAIRLAQIQGNKSINRIVGHQGFMYFATGFGVVKIDIQKNEVKDTYYPTEEGAAVLDIGFIGDSIFVLTANRLLKASLNNFALPDFNQWITDTRLPFLAGSTSYSDLEIIQNEMYVLKRQEEYGQDSVFQLNYSGNVLVNNQPFSLEIHTLSSETDRLLINTDGAILRYNNSLQEQGSVSSFTLGSWFRPSNTVVSGGSIWVADLDAGLREIISATNMRTVAVNGTPKNEYYFMDWQKGKLAVCGGGLSSISPTFSSSGVYFFEDEQWTLKDRDNVTNWNGQQVWDFVSVSINPNDPDQVAVGTYSPIPLSVMKSNGQVDTFTVNNSTLTPTAIGGPWTYVSALSYDDKDNLWVLNAYSDKPLNVLRSDGIWQSFDCGTAAKNKFSRKMVIDYNGNKWFSLDGAGFFGYKDNGTIADASDDDYVQLNSGDNTGALPSNTVTALAVDFDNEIWIGTDNGFAVLYNSDEAFGATPGQYNAQRIKLEFEGNVEYVLGNTAITDIEVDGGNRKWMATASAGIILLSPDGLEILEQHTAENSPLISNNILDLKLDQNTGELFIITDMGMVSYRTNASYEDPEYSNVQVFPNPARPEYDGPITIQGIRYNSDVKITDVAGNLVYMTTSNGGTATWDGKTVNGEKVKTGVYLIWTAANEGKGRKVGKVLVVN